MEGVRERKPILIVDDDDDAREALSLALESRGYSTVTLADGEAALGYLRTQPAPALVLLDLRMPRMDGWAFCEVRRRDAQLSAIPVVMISAFAGPSRAAPYVGINALLAKPVELDLLYDVVERCRSRVPARQRRQSG